MNWRDKRGNPRRVLELDGRQYRVMELVGGDLRLQLLDSDSKVRYDACRRILAKVTVTPEGHWMWPCGDRPYGSFYYRGRHLGVHRVAAEVFGGITIPPRHEPDHLCGVTQCCAPLHLEVVTKSENTRRMHCRRRGVPIG